MFRVGLNPYGLAYAVGLQGAGTPRANPSPLGLEGFVAMARDTGAACLELHGPWLEGAPAAALARLRDDCAAASMTPIVSTGLRQEAGETLDTAVSLARAIGAPIVRLGLSPVLEGSRAAWG